MGIKDIFKKKEPQDLEELLEIAKKNAVLIANYDDLAKRCDPEEIYQALDQARIMGENVYFPYRFEDEHPIINETYVREGKFYSVDVKPDEIYRVITGHNKADYMVVQAMRKETDVEYEAQKQDYIKKGESLILPSHKHGWEYFVKEYAGIRRPELERTLDILQKLKDNADMGEIKKVLSKCRQPYREWIATDIMQWSERGQEFYKEIYGISEHEIDKAIIEEHSNQNLATSPGREIRFMLESAARNRKEIQLANAVASELHEDWRKTRLNKDGSYEPRWKAIKDQGFIKRLNPSKLPSNVRLGENGYEIDIANSTYDQLSADWQYENQEAGKVAAGLVIRREFYEKHLTDKEAGDEIHNEWLKRNTWAKGGELDVPFEKLPKNEQDKDLSQFIVAQSVFERMKQKEMNREAKQQDDGGMTM